MSAADAGAQAELAGRMVAAARAAVDAYDAIVAARVTEPSPAPSGDQETDYRRWLGNAIGRLETADCVLSAAVAEQEGPLLWAVSREAGKVAREIVDFLVSHAPPDADRAELDAAAAELLALWSDASGAAEDQVLRAIARERLGV